MHTTSQKIQHISHYHRHTPYPMKILSIHTQQQRRKRKYNYEVNTTQRRHPQTNKQRHHKRDIKNTS